MLPLVTQTNGNKFSLWWSSLGVTCPSLCLWPMPMPFGNHSAGFWLGWLQSSLGNCTASPSAFRILQLGHLPFYLQRILPSGNWSTFSVIPCSVQMETSCSLTTLPRTDSLAHAQISSKEPEWIMCHPPLQTSLKWLECRRSLVNLFNPTKRVHIQRGFPYRWPWKTHYEAWVIIQHDTASHQHLSLEVYSQCYIFKHLHNIFLSMIFFLLQESSLGYRPLIDQSFSCIVFHVPIIVSIIKQWFSSPPPKKKLIKN